MPNWGAVPLALVLAIVLATTLSMVFGEMVPKNLAIADPERLALWFVPPLVAFVKFARAVIALFNMMANAMLRLLKVEPKDDLEAAYTSSELAQLLVESRREGLLERSEHRRLAQTLSSAENTVADVYVPLSELTSLPHAPTLGAVLTSLRRTGSHLDTAIDATNTPLGVVALEDLVEEYVGTVRDSTLVT